MSRARPYVGFAVVVDARTATSATMGTFERAFAQRRSLRVANHHCDRRIRYVIDVRLMSTLGEAPFFDPPRRGRVAAESGRGELDWIIRTFHNSPHCAAVNRKLIGCRRALQQAWDRFTAEHRGHWPQRTIVRAKHLDYTPCTAIWPSTRGTSIGAALPMGPASATSSPCPFAIRHGPYPANNTKAVGFWKTIRGPPPRYPSTTSGTST